MLRRMIGMEERGITSGLRKSANGAGFRPGLQRCIEIGNIMNGLLRRMNTMMENVE